MSSGYTVTAGDSHTCVLDDNGVSCWGSNGNGESTVPDGLVNPSQVSAGASHTCAVDDNGITCWGSDSNGQSTVPDGLVNPSQVSAGGPHTCALDDNGIICWGDDSYGQSTVPDGLVNPRQVSAGAEHTCALGDSGVTCWGDDGYGQIDGWGGLVNPRQISAGGPYAGWGGEYTTCAVDDNGVSCRERVCIDDLGFIYSCSSVEVAIPDSLVNPSQVSVGYGHSCAMDDNGITCWGDDSYGQSTVPDGLVNARQVSAGGSHTCALDTHGVTCWGDNEFGQSAVPTTLSFTDTSDYDLTPVYRFFSLNTNNHFYTSSSNSRDYLMGSLSWRYEGIAYQAYPSDGGPFGTEPVSRFYSTRDDYHFFVLGVARKNNVLENYPWFRYEGVAYYAYPASDAPTDSLPVYRFFNTRTNAHFYTSDEAAKDRVIANYSWYRYEGVAWHAYGND